MFVADAIFINYLFCFNMHLSKVENTLACLNFFEVEEVDLLKQTDD